MVIVEEMEWKMRLVLGKRIITYVMSVVLLLSLGNLFLVENSSATGTTIFVDDSNAAGPWDGTQTYPYRTIQEGIAAATAGDTVFVFSGSYYGKVTITKNLTLTGENKESTYIDSAGNGHTIQAGVIDTDIEVHLSGFTVKNASATGTGFDCIHFSYITNGEIFNNKILSSQSGEGIALDHNHALTIRNNVISNNDVSAISLTASEDNIIQNNTIQNNQKGIQLDYSSNNTITGNTIRENTIYGIYLYQSSDNIFYLNDVTENGQNAQDPLTNAWSHNNQGNYWDDYDNYDNNSDGIGDVPYTIPGGSNKDYFPLGYFLQPEQPEGENQQPIALSLSISKNPALYGEAISFNGEGTDQDGYIIGFQWRSNLDGILSYAKSFSRSNLSIGTHTIYFKVKDNASAWSAEKTGSVTINYASNVAPVAYIDDISPNPAKLGEPIVFQGHGSDESGRITSYKWLSSKDGVIGTTASFTRTNLSSGTHTISFQVKDETEWSAQATRTLVVGQGSGNPNNQAPIANIGGPYQGQVNQIVYFNGLGSYDAEGEITAHWDFGDNTSGTGLAPTHTYTNVGTYIVTLQVTDMDGVTAVASTSLAISHSASSGDGAEGFIFFNTEIPFTTLIIVVVLILLGVGAGFIFWLRRR